MSYEPINWKNGKTPISAENLNHMDQGIKAMHDVMFSSGYTTRHTVKRCSLISGASWVDGKPKTVASLSFSISTGVPLYLLSAGVYLSDKETVDDTVMYTSDNVFCQQYTEENGEIRFAIRAEYDEYPEKTYAYFRIVYLQGTDVENEIPAIVEEITDARTGRDGTVYNSLGEAIRTQVAGGIENLAWDDLYFKEISKTIVEEKDYDFTYDAELGLYFAYVEHVNVFGEGEKVIAYINYDYNYGEVTKDADGYNCCDYDNLLNGEKPEGMSFALYRGGETHPYEYKMYIYDQTGSTDSTKNFTISVVTKKSEYHPIYPWYLDKETVLDRLLPSAYNQKDGMHVVIENGEWVAKEFETTGDTERTTLVEKEERQFVLYDYFGKYGYGFDTEPFVPVAGEEYIVVWGDNEYTCTAQEAVIGENTGIGFGNASVFGLGEDTEEPFCLMYGEGIFVIFSVEDTEASSHAFGIYQDMSNGLPEVTTEDNGKFLQVVNGKWKAVAITNGNEVAY